MARLCNNCSKHLKDYDTWDDNTRRKVFCHHLGRQVTLKTAKTCLKYDGLDKPKPNFEIPKEIVRSSHTAYNLDITPKDKNRPNPQSRDE